MNGDINLIIRDDGIGVPLEKIENKSSLGLTGIKERVRQFNGDFKINSSKETGTELIIKIPNIK